MGERRERPIGVWTLWRLVGCCRERRHDSRRWYVRMLEVGRSLLTTDRIQQMLWWRSNVFNWSKRTKMVVRGRPANVMVRSSFSVIVGLLIRLGQILSTAYRCKPLSPQSGKSNIVLRCSRWS